MSESTSVRVSIPGPYGSRSKMQRKGWKCWAKRIAHVNDPANSGYDWEGEFLAVGTVAELTAGDIVLHVDESSSSAVGVVMPDGGIEWLRSTHGKWASDLAATARKALAMETKDRLAEGRSLRRKAKKEAEARQPETAPALPTVAERPDAEAPDAIDLSGVPIELLQHEIARRQAAQGGNAQGD